MKKALIAAAVAGAFAAPSAMAAELSTNVYWSQAIAVGETTTTSNGIDATANNDKVFDGGGNRLMFTWTDTLDNGIGVSAYLSFGNLGTANAGGVNTRNANVGFSGDFGTVQIGANEHFSETDLIFDPSYADFGDTGDALSFIRMGQTGFNFT
jgi:predicted porin